MDITGRYYCEYDDRAGNCIRASKTTVESQVPDLNLQARIDRLKQVGFSGAAIGYYMDDLPVLENGIGVLTLAEIEEINQTAEALLVEGRTYGDGSLREDAARVSSVVASLTPIVGDIKDIQEALTGVDIFTGERLEPWERWVSGAAAIAPAIPGWAARGLIKGVGAVLESSRHAGAAKLLGSNALQAGAKATHYVLDAAKVQKRVHSLRSMLYGMARVAQKLGSKVEWHHLLPVQFKEFFEQAGLRINKWMVPLTQEVHKVIHGKGGSLADGWNAKWEAFRELNPGATADEILEQLWRMLDDFDLESRLIEDIKRLQEVFGR